MSTVSACIVNYNDYENTKKAVNSLLEYTKGVDFELFLVDNHSDDGSYEKLKEDFSSVNIIRTEKNGGFGFGHNAVFSELDSKYHAVVNPDIILKEDVLSKLAEFFEKNEDIAVACPATYFENGDIQLLPKRLPKFKYLLAGRLKTKGLKEARKYYIMEGEDLSKVTDVDFVTGCFMFMRTEYFKKVGGFDERYFMYFEDADLTRELKKYGRAVYYPDAKVIHGYNRESTKNIKLFIIHVLSMFKYFAKWRKEKNK